MLKMTLLNYKKFLTYLALVLLILVSFFVIFTHKSSAQSILGGTIPPYGFTVDVSKNSNGDYIVSGKCSSPESLALFGPTDFYWWPVDFIFTDSSFMMIPYKAGFIRGCTTYSFNIGKLSAGKHTLKFAYGGYGLLSGIADAWMEFTVPGGNSGISICIGFVPISDSGSCPATELFLPKPTVTVNVSNTFIDGDGATRPLNNNTLVVSWTSTGSANSYCYIKELDKMEGEPPMDIVVEGPSGNVTISGLSTYTVTAVTIHCVEPAPLDSAYNGGVTIQKMIFGPDDESYFGVDPMKVVSPNSKIIPTATISADNHLIPSGSRTMIRWSSTNATKCTLSGEGSGSQGLRYWASSYTQIRGLAQTEYLTSNKTYNLTCSGPAGISSIASVTVNVGGAAVLAGTPLAKVASLVTPLPVLTFSATPTIIDSGQSSNLSWASTDTTSCTAGGAWTGSKASSGNESTGALTAGKTYTLNCTGAGGTTATQSVTVGVNAVVLPPIPNVSISATDSAISYNTGTNINWNSTNATSCTASGAWAGIKATSGTFATGNLTSSQTYNITCTGAGGTSPSVGVRVNVGMAPPVSCISSLNACGATNNGFIVNGTCNATVPLNPTGYGTACKSSQNSCGMTNTGTKQCDLTCSAVTPLNSSCSVITPTACVSSKNSCGLEGSGFIVNGTCNATVPLNPTGYGTTCTSSQNSCGMTNTGTKLCNGSCSAVTPLNSSCSATDPTACVSAQNSCGATNNGIIVGGVCNAIVPANPTGYGTSCTSSQNSCGMKNTGTKQCDLTCSAVTPLNSSCLTAPTACVSAKNSCGLEGSGFIISGTCNAIVPANPTGYGTSCTSSQNSCGQTNTGTKSCNGSCSANTPPNSSCPSDSSLSAVNAPAPTLTFTANDTSINSGASVELRWTAVNVDSCNATGDWTGQKSVSGVTSTGNIISSKIYSLVCAGAGGSVSRSINVNVSGSVATAPSIISPIIAAPAGGSNLSPTMIFVADRDSPGHVRFSWSSTNATSCVAGDGWSGSKGTSGNSTLSVSSNTRFTLTCSGNGGEASRTLQVNVESGASDTAPTNVTNPSVTNPSIPTKPASKFVPKGPVAVPLTSSVVRENSNGDIVAVSSGKTSQVSPPIISLLASPIVAFNNTANIEWSVANAVKCSASGNWQGEKEANGKEISTPLQKDAVYTLRCEGNGGEAARTVEVVVTKEVPTVTRLVNNFFGGISNRISNLFSSPNKEIIDVATLPTETKTTDGQEGIVNTTNPPVAVTPNTISSNSPSQMILYVTPIVKSGSSATIEWSSTNVSTCIASGDWNGGKPVEGSEMTADLFADATYTLNCFGDNGTTTATVEAIVFEEEGSFLGKIQKNVIDSFYRIIDIFKGNSNPNN